jgi:hypothetical protein
MLFYSVEFLRIKILFRTERAELHRGSQSTVLKT